MNRNRMGLIVVGALLVMLGGGRQVFAGPLPVTSGLIYRLDATDATKIAYDGSNNITSWTSSEGSAVGFSMAPVTGVSYISPPTYQATGGGGLNLPNVKFVATNPPLAVQKLVQNAGGSTTPMCVFIMENSDSPPGIGLGGIWGRDGVDTGIRFWSDNGPAGGAYGDPTEPGNTHQLVNHVIGTVPRWDWGVNVAGSNGQPINTDNYYWSDMTVSDGRQSWHYKNWGTLGAYNYNSGDNTFAATALGNYFHPNEGRSWSGQIGEVIAYDRWLTDDERLQVETYLTYKWLTPEPATLSLLGLGGLGLLLRRKRK